jgi:hypothetical protein
MMTRGTKASLTVAGTDLGRLLNIMQTAGAAFAVTVVHTPHPTLGLHVGAEHTPSCTVVDLEQTASTVDVRALLEHSPGVRFIFLAEELPVRHAVARVIREGGHEVLARDEASVVITATAVALLATHEKVTR